MVEESLILTRELVAKAVLWLIKLVEFSEKDFYTYSNEGLSICIVREGEVLNEFSFKVERWPSGANFSQKAEKLAKMVCREKKNSKNLLSTPAKIREDDYKGLGGIWSSECNIGIGIHGFLEGHINDEVAKHLLVKIKALCAIDSTKTKSVQL